VHGKVASGRSCKATQLLCGTGETRPRMLTFQTRFESACGKRNCGDAANAIASTGTAMGKFVERWLPVPHVLHPWPSVRFAAQHPS